MRERAGAVAVVNLVSEKLRVLTQKQQKPKLTSNERQKQRMKRKKKRKNTGVKSKPVDKRSSGTANSDALTTWHWAAMKAKK